MRSIYPVILANTKFSIDLLKAVCKNRRTNEFFSPLSISSALGLVVLGSRGNTENQMMRALHFDKMRIMYHDLYEAINKDSPFYKLILANRLYGERSCDFKDDYLDKCEDWCAGGFRSVDFKENPNDARLKINNWVEKETQNKTGGLLDAHDIDKNTLLALVSTMYFKGSWDQPFNPDESQESKFHTSKSESVMVKMMTQTGVFPMATIPEADMQILELSYLQKELSMFIMLPNSFNLEKIEHHITHEKVQEWTEEDKLIPTEIKISVPPVKMDCTYDLEKILKKLGITDAFTDECDFSGMTSKPLKLSKVVHKSGLYMNEQGTEAEAGTGEPTSKLKSFRCESTDDKQRRFLADRPFLYFIRHNDTKSILFWGRFCSPSSKTR